MPQTGAVHDTFNMSSRPTWQRGGALKMVRSRNSLILAFVAVFVFVIYNYSDVLPATSISSVNGSPSNPENLVQDSEVSSRPSEVSDPSSSQRVSTPPNPPKPSNSASSANSGGSKYFGQVFAQPKPDYDFPALAEHCAATTWPEDEVYIQCGGMSAGLTSIMSQLKVCLKMAVETGTSIVLPSMPLRDSTNLQEFNFMNGDAYMPYDEWFDAEHLIEGLGKACPKMKIVHPKDLDTPSTPVKAKWSIDLSKAPGYMPFIGTFWTGRPFKAFFNGQLEALEQMAAMNPDKDDTKKGITVVSIASQFLLFRITDDPTQGDLKLWNDLGLLIRFKEEVRSVVGDLMGILGGLAGERGFYGVHFRVENDTIWSGIEHQLAVDLEALDAAWTRYGQPGAAKPLVYLACGDQMAVTRFSEEATGKGWDVVHKWALAQARGEGNLDLLSKIGKLPFDFQGAVDMAIMINADFFFGITGSAFSSSIGNIRDATGRYRGSSLTGGLVGGDGGARTHLFNDGDAGSYACCL